LWNQSQPFVTKLKNVTLGEAESKVLRGKKGGKKAQAADKLQKTVQSKIISFTSQLQVDALMIGLFRAQCHSYLMWSDIMYIANVTNVHFCTVDKQLAHPNSWSFIMLKKYRRASYVSQGLVRPTQS